MIKAMIRFTKGPASDIVPFFFTFMLPEINTAPGAARIKPKNDITKAIINI